MNGDNIFLKVIRKSGPAKFLILLGLAVVVFGMLMLIFNTDNYIKTTGRITSVTECLKEEDEAQGYDIDFTYSVKGKELTGTFSNLGGTYNVGDDIDVYYDPGNPGNISNSKTGFLPIIIIVAGAGIMIFGVYKIVIAVKNNE